MGIRPEIPSTNTGSCGWIIKKGIKNNFKITELLTAGLKDTELSQGPSDAALMVTQLTGASLGPGLR